MTRITVGILGATGMVGQRFVSLLQEHPWFEIGAVAASPASCGKTYAQAVEGRWTLDTPVPNSVANMLVDSVYNIEHIASNVDFVFSALAMPKRSIYEIEEAYARLECPVISNNSAHRHTHDVPMIIPELNPSHAEIIPFQRQRLHTKRGFIAVKCNCSIQSYLPLLYPLDKVYGLKEVIATTYQAVSGAGRRLCEYECIWDNVIPYIEGEEAKSELEPLKLMGALNGGSIIPSNSTVFSVKCCRVPISDGHMAAVFARFDVKPKLTDVIALWRKQAGWYGTLPSAPMEFIHYFDERDRPQTMLDRAMGNGMTISAGGLSYDNCFDIHFMGLSHNILRGAAGGGVLLAELLTHMGYLK